MTSQTSDADDSLFARERLAGYDPAIVEARVLLVGAGALGSALALQLSMWGFRRGAVIDPDVYEMSNATRVPDFPWERVRAGETVAKAEHVARGWGARVNAATGNAEINAEVGYLQECPAECWNAADVVLGAVDHPRARFDLVQIARRYGKPVAVARRHAATRGSRLPDRHPLR